MTTTEPHKVIIDVEGGIIQSIKNIPPGIIIEVRDYDVEGADTEEIKTIDGEEAVISTWYPLTN
jgi:hypothetical protein